MQFLSGLSAISGLGLAVEQADPLYILIYAIITAIFKYIEAKRRAKKNQNPR